MRLFQQPPEQHRHHAPEQQALHRPPVDPQVHIEIVHQESGIGQALASDSDGTLYKRLRSITKAVRQKNVQFDPNRTICLIQPPAQQTNRKSHGRRSAHHHPHPDRSGHSRKKAQQCRQHDEQGDTDGGRTAVRPPVTEHHRRSQQRKVEPFQLAHLPPADIHNADSKQDRTREVEPPIAKAVTGANIANVLNRLDPSHGSTKHHRKEAGRAHRKAHLERAPGPDVLRGQEIQHAHDRPKMPVVQEHPAEHEKEAEARPQLQAGVTGEEHHLHDDQPEVDDFQLRCQKGIPAGAALPHIAVHEEHVELQQRHGDKEQPAADLFPLRGGPISEEVHFLPEPAAHFLRKGHFFKRARPASQTRPRAQPMSTRSRYP